MVLIHIKNDILGFTAVNACFPSMESMFHGVKHRFHVEDPLMQLRGYVYEPIINDEVSYG